MAASIESIVPFSTEFDSPYDNPSQSFLMSSFTDYEAMGHLADQGVPPYNEWTDHYVVCHSVIRGSSPSDSAASPTSPTLVLGGSDITSSSTSTSTGRASRSPLRIAKEATVPRSHRYNPLPTAAARKNAARKHAVKQNDSDDDFDGDDYQEATSPTSVSGPMTVTSGKRNDAVRKQRIESEQRRRDELRDGYTKLREVLPPSQQKLSKAALLDKATTHVSHLSKLVESLQNKFNQSEMELARLRKLNEKLMLKAVERVPVSSTPRPY